MTKKLLFLVTMMLALATGQLRAQTAYAVYVENDANNENKATFYFTYCDESLTPGGTFTPAGGSEVTITNVWSGDDVTNTGTYSPKWSSILIFKKVTKVVIEDNFNTVGITSCFNWFCDLYSLTSVEGLTNLNTSSVTTMENMFSGCCSLASLNLSNFNTSSVKTMKCMFYSCKALTTLDLGSLNTSNVTNMEGMFVSCNSLTTLDLSNFNTSNVTDMNGMFSGCSSLTAITFGDSFDTSSVTNMGKMFKDCSALTSLNLSTFVTSSVTIMNYMFSGCSALTSLDLSKFVTSSVTTMSYMFKACSSLKSLTLGNNFNTESATGTTGMFGEWNTNKLTVLDISSGCPILSTLGDSGASIADVIDNGTTKIYVNDANKSNWSSYTTLTRFTIDANQGSLSVAADKTVDNVIVKRSFKGGNPHTVCFPFALSTATYGKFYEYSTYDAALQTVKFKEVESGSTEPNKPYLFIPDADLANIEINAETAISATSGLSNPTSGLIGVYEKLTFDETNKANCYGWANGEFKKAGTNATVPACRAYLKLPAGSKAPARLSISLDGDDDVTAIDAVSTETGADAPAYNLQGQRVSRGYKGVVIRNGKKMIIK